MPKMTKPLRLRHDKLDRAVSDAQTAVFAAAPNGDTPFSQCLSLASPETRHAYESAVLDRDAFEREMIAQGRAWRGCTSNLIFWN